MHVDRAGQGAVVDSDSASSKRIMLYDSNHPGEERYIKVDTQANTWEYVAAVNPEEAGSLYAGNPANNNLLYVAAVRPRLGRHACFFCAAPEGSPDALSSNAEPEATSRALLAQGNVEPLVTDSYGFRIGKIERVGSIVS